MKTTSHSDVPPPLDFKVSFAGRQKFDTPERATKILRFIAEDSPMRPNKCSQTNKFYPFSEAVTDTATRFLVDLKKQQLTPDRPSGDVFLENDRDTRCLYRIAWSRGPHTPFGLSGCSVESSVAMEESQRNIFVDHILRVADHLDAWYGMFALKEEREAKTTVRIKERIGPKTAVAAHMTKVVAGCHGMHKRGLPGVFWGTYFGAFYVDWLGRERFEDVPCVEKRELSNGAYFITVAESPLEWDTPAARTIAQTVREHLGADAFTDAEGIQTSVAGVDSVFPYNFNLHSLGYKVRLPEFPFADELIEPTGVTLSEWIESTVRYFKAYGFEVLSVDGDQVTFTSEDGGIMEVKRGPDGVVRSIPGHSGGP